MSFQFLTRGTWGPRKFGPLREEILDTPLHGVQSPAVATQHPRWSLFSVSISVVGGRQTTK